MNADRGALEVARRRGDTGAGCVDVAEADRAAPTRGCGFFTSEVGRSWTGARAATARGEAMVGKGKRKREKVGGTHVHDMWGPREWVQGEWVRVWVG